MTRPWTSSRQPSSVAGVPKAKTKARQLNDRQRRFVEAYARSGNATGSYREAGYTARGNSCEASACKLLRLPKVAEAVEKARQCRSRQDESLWAKAERALHRLLDRAEGKGKGKGGRISDGAALKAIELAGKVHGKFRDRHEISGPDGGPVEVTDWARFEAGLRRLAGESQG